jgi:DNA-binding LytR/AlgR family response regulator
MSKLFTFTTRLGKQLVSEEELVFVKADNKYLDFYTDRGMFTGEESLKSLEAEFSKKVWMRVHRNALVRKSAIRNFNPITRVLGVELNGEIAEIPVSRRHKPDINNLFKMYKSRKGRLCV